MGSRSLPATTSLELKHPWRLLMLAAVIPLLLGGLFLNAPFEDALRVARNALTPEKASGDIVLISVDEQSLHRVGEWPWPRSKTAKIVDEVRRLGGNRLFLDFVLDNKTARSEDMALSSALERFGKATIPARNGLGPFQSDKSFQGYPLKIFADVSSVASISVNYNYQHAVWDFPYGDVVHGKAMQSYASALVNHRRGDDTFPIRYAIDPQTIPSIRAADLLEGRVARSRVAGKTLVLAPTADNLGDQYWIPGRGKMAGAYVMILGAETLKRGDPVDLGWLIPLVAVIVVAGISLTSRGRNWRTTILAATAGTLLIVPILLERQLIFVDVATSLFSLCIIGGRLGWLRWKSRGLTNAISGLPNLTALRGGSDAHNYVLIAARVQNFAEIASVLESEQEQQLVRQVVDRLAVARVDQQVFQGEEGTFVWLVEPGDPIGNHLEALHALFRSPLNVGGRTIDLAVSFGAELGSARTLANRLGSALVAADEAWAEGLKWKYHDPARQEEVTWRLSLLGELDAAIDNGEVWLAYQPQLDLKTGVVTGAEALARWTHPVKGPIGPSEFIAAAEANGRIGKLTDFVLDRAISTAAAINRRGIPFTIAVNLSARLLSERQWIERVETLLTAYGLAPQCLTLELTETATLQDADGGLAMLDALCALGVRIAIDDYGTGLSTLDYLKKVPAKEIKLDQSFVKAMRVNRGDLIMVQSTIALAHSLGRSVVAEGVEDRQCLEDLKQMGCDVAQGFVIGRPMGVRELIQRMEVRNHRRVA